MNKKSSGSANPFASSMIITLLGRASGWIYRKLSGSLIGGMFTAYERENAAVSDSAAAKIIRKPALGERLLMPAKRKLASGIENSTILGFVRRILDGMLASSMKSYGIFMFSSALYSAIVYLFKTFYFGETVSVDVGMVLTLVVMLIMSVMMIASRQTLANALLTSPSARFILLRVAGIRRETLEGREERDGKFNVAFIAGLVFGVLSFFVHPLFLLIGILGLIAAYLVLIKPELGVLAIVTALPFAPTMGLVAAVFYTSFCFILKVMCGKRSIKFDLLDGVVLAFMLLMAGGGLVAASDASIKPMLVYVAFMLGYFLVVNLIRSREWFMRCIVGVLSSCTLVSLYGLYQNFFGTVEQTWQDSDMFSEIEGRVVSTFENPNVLAEYLIMVIPLILAMFIITKAPRARLILAAAGLAAGGCLIYTWSRGAWLGFLIGILIFMLMYSRHTLTALLFCALGVPFLPFVLPESITQRFLSIGNLGDSSTSYRVNIWRGVIDMIGDYWQSGIGIGNDSFSLVYPLYALSGIETAPHAHNLYLQIIVELGAIGLVVFLAVLFIYTQSSLSLHVNESRRDKLLSTAIFCGMLAVLAQGMTDYIWYNYRVFLMFWLMLGLGAAIRKTLNTTAVEDIY
ncbi:MAG: O-antigen ligase family protein [Clostridia bacterium]|nr:O-antigen ligase family protein [Clostridia bacterium]